MNSFHVVLTLLAAFGSGLIGGFFYAFSAVIMKSLTRLAPGKGIAAMQSINITVINRWFMTPFVGTAALCVALIVTSLTGWREPAAMLRLIGSGVYLVGTFLVTGVFNVPRNDALAAVEADSAAGAEVWARDTPSWTAWNTVRTVAALVAAVLLVLSLVVGRAGPLVAAMRPR